MMDSSDAATEAARAGRQLRPGLWQTINERYPGSLVTKADAVPLARLCRPLSESRLTFISTSGVQPKGTLPFDVVHPIGDFSFRRVPSMATSEELEIHQLKYPTSGARRDLNVIFPIERLQELAAEGVIGGLTPHFFTFIGYNMDPERFERTLAEEIADAVVADGADIALAAPA
ncbi:MAG: glycine/sarcosine/betaine reductase selenoprotein B family protein [Ktedonobacterales bacterium]